MLIDFTKISMEENTFETLAEGKYIVKCTNCESKVSRNTGNEFWSVTYETKDGDKIFDKVFFTEKCLNRVKKLFHTLGLDVETKIEYTPEDIIGCYMNADVSIEEYDYNGTTRKKNVINLWRCEPYTVKKTTTKKVENIDEIPF